MPNEGAPQIFYYPLDDISSSYDFNNGGLAVTNANTMRHDNVIFPGDHDNMSLYFSQNRKGVSFLCQIVHQLKFSKKTKAFWQQLFSSFASRNKRFSVFESSGIYVFIASSLPPSLSPFSRWEFEKQIVYWFFMSTSNLDWIGWWRTSPATEREEQSCSIEM